MVLLLAGCQSAPQIRREVKVPVIISCISDPIEPAPKLATDDELKALDDYRLPLALWLDRKERQLYQQRLEATVEACRSAQPPPN